MLVLTGTQHLRGKTGWVETEAGTTRRHRGGKGHLASTSDEVPEQILSQRLQIDRQTAYRSA